MKEFLCSFFLLCLVAHLNAQTIRYVKPFASGNGTSWADAGDLQSMINGSNANDSVFVAGGVYQPSFNNSFTMKEGVKIYGSFAGTESSLSDRDLKANLLAGDSSILKGNNDAVIYNDNNNLTNASELNGFVITQGQASYGAGMLNNNSSPTVVNCIFRGNTAAAIGGGLYNNANSSPKIINCLFFDNIAPTGAQIGNRSASGSLTNTTIIGNRRSDVYAYGLTTWKNCIILGGISGSNYVASNCLLTGPQAQNVNVGNIDAGLYSPDEVFTNFASGDYSLALTSPAVDAGTPNTDTAGLNLPVIDLGGNKRILNGRIDMGAFESQNEPKITVRYVKSGATGGGTSWSDAGDFQSMIDASDANDSVFVAGGVYQPSANNSFTMKEGVKIYGSFSGTESRLSDRDLKVNLLAGDSSILKGNIASVIFNDDINLTNASELNGFVITQGQASYGAGMFNNNASPTVVNCIFRGNTAAAIGGGLYNNANSSPIIINCLFYGNKALTGGEVGNNSGHVSLINTTIIGNGNKDVYANGLTTLKNCIIWSDIYRSNYITSNCLLTGPQAQNVNVGNIDASLYSPDEVFTNFAGGDYTLIDLSPAINAGTPNTDTAGLNLPAIDLGGNIRIFNGRIDMGAFESKKEPKSTVRYVKPGATGGGTSWADAGDFQSMIDASNPNDSVFVAGGVYQPSAINSFTMKEGVKIYGSFAGTESSLSDRDLKANLLAGDSSILKGNNASVIYNNNNSLTSTSELNGFIITGGKAFYGAGMRNESASPTVINCIFRGNTATGNGGGLYNNSNSSTKIINCLFFGNKAPTGAQIGNNSGNGSLTNTTVIGNGNSDIYAYGWTTWKNCIIWGGIFGLNYVTRNCLLTGPKATNVNVGNINASLYSPDDVFTNFAGGDYTLIDLSPAINAGTQNVDTAGLNLPAIDLGGNKRISNDRIDMGAFEYQQDAALPVNILNFTGQLKTGMAHLQWQSALETGFKQYELEKSLDGFTFAYLATIPAMGNNSTYNYSAAQKASSALYRLKLTDIDGQSKYYEKILTLSQKTAVNLFKLYPNPTHNNLKIEVNQVGRLQIFDATGKIVIVQQLKPGANNVQLNGLSAGFYYAVLNGQTIKFSKL